MVAETRPRRARQAASQPPSLGVLYSQAMRDAEATRDWGSTLRFFLLVPAPVLAVIGYLAQIAPAWSLGTIGGAGAAAAWRTGTDLVRRYRRPPGE